MSKKLQIKDQSPLLVIGAPDTFDDVISEFSQTQTVVTQPVVNQNYAFLLAFVKRAADIEQFAAGLEDLVEDEALVWFAYPKKSSKRFTSDISRDNGWQPLGDLGYEGVRQIAIDEDWSALRFRKAEAIQKMTRRKTMAMSKEGKAKTIE